MKGYQVQELGQPVEVIRGRVSASSSFFENRILDALPSDEAARLAPYLERVFLHRARVLDDAGEASRAVYFPVDALICSAINTTGTGRTSPLWLVGRRGGADVAGASLGLPLSVETTVLCPGTSWRLDRSIYEAAETVRAPLYRAMRRFERALFAVGAARLACNSEHNVDRRVARWLLFVADETGKPQAELTHQQLADLAAIRRPSVSLVFSDLARRGIVHVQHGLVQILDRERLEEEACPCSSVICDLLGGI